MKMSNLSNKVIQTIFQITESISDKQASHAIPNSWIPVNGDLVTGDTVRFKEAVFSGSYKSPRHVGDREVTAEVLNDSYGKGKQQHTFTIRVIHCTGYDCLTVGKVTTRKGRNIYRNSPIRLTWVNEEDRGKAAEDKHKRGAAAREQRDIRREMESEEDW